MPRTKKSTLHPKLRHLHNIAKDLGHKTHQQKSNYAKTKDLQNMSQDQNKKLRAQFATEKAREKKKYYQQLLETALDISNETVKSLRLAMENMRNETLVIRSKLKELVVLRTIDETFGLESGVEVKDDEMIGLDEF